MKQRRWTLDIGHWTLLRSPPEQYTNTAAVLIRGNNVEFGVTVYVGDRQSPNTSSCRKRRAGRRPEVATAVAEHNPHPFTRGCKRINTAVAVYIREGHLKRVAAPVKWRTRGF